MSDELSSIRAKILASRVKPIEVVIGADLQLHLRGLTAADAARIADAGKMQISARDKVVHVVHNQVESPAFSQADIRSWDDDQLLKVFFEWAAKENTLNVPVSAEAGMAEAAEAIDQFARQWSRDIRNFAASPAVALANSVTHIGLQGITDPLGLGKLRRELRELEQMSRRMWDPIGVARILEGMQGAELATKMGISPSVARQLASVAPPSQAVWAGTSLVEKLDTIHQAISVLGGMNTIPALSMTRTTLLAESALIGVDLAALAGRLAIPASAADSITDAVRVHLQAYGDLVADLSETVPTIDARLAYEIPAIEAFNEASMARALSGPYEVDEAAVERRERSREIEDELEVEFPDLLRGLDPDLIRLWEGARQARRGDNVDRSRHVGVSLRTLFDDVLNHIAPEKRVKQWCGPEDLRENGQVKREVRFRYIARKLEYKRVRTAFEADMEALVAAYGVLNGLHEGSLDLSARELGLVILRIESALRWAIIAAQED